MGIDAVQVADHVDIERALAERATAAPPAATKMLVEYLVLQRPEGVLLPDEAPGRLDIAGRKHAGGKAQVFVDDEAEIVEGGLFLDAERDAFLGLGFDTVGKIEMDDIAGVFQIADVERQFPGRGALAFPAVPIGSARRDSLAPPTEKH